MCLYGEIIPELELKLGDYLSVQAHKPCSISHIKGLYDTYPNDKAGQVNWPK